MNLNDIEKTGRLACNLLNLEFSIKRHCSENADAVVRIGRMSGDEFVEDYGFNLQENPEFKELCLKILEQQKTKLNTEIKMHIINVALEIGNLEEEAK